MSMRTLLALSIAAALMGCRHKPVPAAPEPVPAPAPMPATESVAVPAPEPAPMPAPAPQPGPQAANIDVVATLREANALAAQGRIDEANRLFTAVVDAPNAFRDAIIGAAVGLYRGSDYAGAARAFGKLGTFARGEEDLRYYYAVALYETGRYAEAKRELACALPYIEVTADIARVQAKIEGK